MVDYLTTPLPHYERRGRSDLAQLKARVRKGDVILVEGDQRVSAIIRYLTQSSWSHAVLYIGDELLARDPALRRPTLDQFGAEAAHLVVEALPQGVVASPLAKYVDLNTRICRPHGLRPEHLRSIMDEAVAAIGWRYDLRNVFDLARYLVPVTVLPTRWRMGALHFGSGVPTEVICSSLIARLFQRVRFPIFPAEPEAGASQPPARRRWAERIFGRPSREYTGLFRMRHPTLVTPRDFDLSPWFEIVKLGPTSGGHFDYSRLRWADAEPEAAPDRAPRRENA